MEIQPVQVSSVTQMKFLEKQRKKAKSGGFESMGLGPEVYRGIKRKGYKVPTPIQRKTMPLILSGLDVVAMARTGSGKTAAFLIPMLQKLKEHSATAGVRALILAPTRELAFQTFKFCKELGRFTGIQATLLVGGDSFESQFEQLAKSPDVLIATLGRLTHHLAEVEGMSLRSVEYVVFDEADRLFEMGFAEQLRTVLSQLSESRQTLLFSATLPRALADFAKAGLRDPELVRLDLETKISPDLKLAFFTLRPEEKPAALLYLVREQISSKQQTIVFVATKHHVEFLNAFLEQEGIQLSIVYGDMDQVARKIHLAKFRTRKTMLLLVTDVAARGIDIPLLDNVVNYDFPPKPKLFVHRVGRAARAGRVGTAYSFVTAEEMPYMLDLHLFLSKPIRSAPTEEEVAYDSDNVLALIQDAEEKGETIYGKFPQSVLDLVSEKLRELLEDYSEIYLLHKACMNAFRLYSKTKPAPSTESVRRAKEFPREGLHPIFKLDCAKNEVDALAFSERLKEFRPKQTVLETEGEVAKAKKLHTPICQGVDVMKMKRAIHEKVINATQQQKVMQKTEIIPNDNDSEAVASVKKRKRGIESLVKKSFRDEEYYINPIPSNQHTEAGLSVKAGENFGPNRIDAAVLDLVADDSSGIQKQKARHHWDKKSKKYIKLNNGDCVTASGKVKTEGGLKVKSGSTGLYKRWQERSHMKISAHRHGDEAHDDGNEERGQRGRNNKYTKRKPIPNANVRDEVRGVDQIRKQRQKKETKKILWNDKQKGAKGQNFGNKQRGSKGQSFGSKQKGSNGQSFGKSGKRSFKGKGNRK